MIELHPHIGVRASVAIAGVKLVACEHPGDHRLAVAVVVPQRRCSRPVERRLTLGPQWTYSGSPECLAALAEFGEARVVAREN